MADVVTNTQLLKRIGSGGGAVITSGEAIIAGNTVYKNADSNWYLAWANTTGNSIQAGFRGVGIALASAPGVGQPVSIFTAGTIYMGASGTLVKGQSYVLSSNKGRVCPVSDLTTNMLVTFLGVANDSDHIVTPTGGMFVTNTVHA